MNEINFFRPYENLKNNKSSLSKYLPFLILLVLFAGMAIYQIQLNTVRNNLENEVSHLSEEINRLEKSDDFLEVNQLKEKNNMIKELFSSLEETITNIEAQFIINRKMIADLVNQTPLNTYITSIDYNDHSIVVKCITDTYNSAAQYFYNLKQVDEFESAFLPTIEEDEGDYSYQINIELGGEKDETQ